jgi:dTMP kinase
MSKSLFITFEGGEGAGKTTLIDRLYKALKAEKKSVIMTRAPGGTDLGDEIRNLLLHHKEMSPRAELLLFMADRAEHTDEVIKPALKKGKIVLCDRYNDSTVAYQGYGRGFGEKWARELCAFATGDLEPDLTFYLDLKPEEGLKRVSHRSKDRIEKEKLAFHRKIRKAYLSIAKKEPKRFHVLDASKNPNEVFQDAWTLISTF